MIDSLVWSDSLRVRNVVVDHPKTLYCQEQRDNQDTPCIRNRTLDLDCRAALQMQHQDPRVHKEV